jgi:hypothetical protein
MNEVSSVDLAERWRSWRREFEEVCGRVGRAPASIKVIAVSKTRSVGEIKAAMDLGLTDFGENRVQEAEPKIATVSGDPTWHLVGHLQTNKANKATRLFAWVQSVDSIRIAEALGQSAEIAGRTVSVLVQVNTTGEAQKSGCQPEAITDVVDAVFKQKRLRLSGLMTVGPLEQTESATRRSFELAARLRQEWMRKLPGETMAVLSMGMSGDWPWALEYGADWLRIGSAIFGDRPS